MAWAAPLSPEVDEHWLVALKDFLLERGFRDCVCHIW
jgi:hypothetical protein